MPVNMTEEADGKIVSVELSGKLTKKDYERFAPEMASLVRKHGKVRMLVRMHDFQGWSAGALWEDIKFAWEHFSDIERIALVGDQKWQAGMAAFCKPFTKATVRYFDEKDVEKAIDWTNAGVAQLVEAR